MVIAWFNGGFLVLSLCAAAVSCWAAARLSTKLLVFAGFLARLSALETQTEKILAMQKRLAQRQNLGEYREREAETPAPRSNKVPDWQNNPAGFIQFHESKMRGR